VVLRNFGQRNGSLGFPRIRTPRMDIYEEDDKVVAEVELPGVDPKNIEVEVKDNVLKSNGKGKEVKEEKGKGILQKGDGGKIFQKRSFVYPTEVIEEKAEAEYENGILRVTIPKAKPKEEKKKIKIKVKTKEA